MGNGTVAKRLGRTAIWMDALGNINNAAENLFKEVKGYATDYPKVLYWIAAFYDSRYLSFYTKQRHSISNDKNMWQTRMLEQGKKNLSKTSDVMTLKSASICEQSINSKNAKLATYINDVVCAYGDCLVTPMKKRMNVVASRFITLWFNQPGYLNHIVKDYLNRITLSYLLPFFPQIVGMISADDECFQTLLFSLIVKMCREFPHQTLFPTVCLAHQRYVNQQTFGGRQAANYVADEGKEQVANKILNEVAADAKLKDTVKAVRAVAKFYHDLADLHVTAEESKAKKSYSLDRIKSYAEAKKYAKYLPPITAKANNVCMEGLPSTYRHVGSGLSCPCILEVRDRNGKIHKQLVKGKDDLRQDMVVQQMFEHVNQVFEDNGRDGRLRTYKVVPLSPSSGVCEFVEGAISLGDYILDAKQRYYPEDWNYKKCWQIMAPLVAKDNNVPTDRKLAGFKRILDNTHPVLHLFFYEHFADPQEWFRAKQRFWSSVAVSSMVGYIIGLGDRHLQNILIDPRSGELIHIDFGMTFDYGMNYQGIPELVPFRLTRDMVSALGPMGINQGRFRKCCVESMRTMRDFSEVFMAIVEVFVNDPMVRWCNITRDDASAKIAVIAVREKLQGIDDDSTSSVGLSVEMLVERLLNRATDKTLLCQMFQGWAAWC